MKLSKVTNNTKCEVVNGGFTDLVSLLSLNTWSPSLFKDDYRSKSNFKQSEILGLDFDEGLSLAAATGLFSSYKHIIGTTKSHQKNKNGKVCDRFRVILFLESPVTNVEVYESTVAKFLNDFPNADQACKDASRQFYPCVDIVSSNEKGNLVSIEYNTSRQTPQSAIPNTTEEFDRDVIKKIKRLPDYVFDRLMNPPSDNWHSHFLPVWGCYAKLQIPIESAIQHIGKYISLDSTDMYQLKDAYSRNYFPPDKSQSKKKMSQAEYQSLLLCKLDYFFKDKFIVVEDVLGSRRMLEILGDNEVRFAPMDRVLGHLINNVRDTEYMSNFNTLKQTVNSWMASTSDVYDEPPAVAFKDTDHYTYQRLQFEPKPGDTPCLDMIMNNVNNSQSMMAFIWSLLEPRSYKQQAVWWYGLGGDGKGSISRVLQDLFGKSYMGTSSDDYNSNKSFFFSNLVGKRVVVFSDENNSRLLMTNWFKRITGDDSVTINPKGEKAYSTRLDIKAMVFSNREPDFDNTKAHLRRIIYCTPKGKLDYAVDPLFEEKLSRELPYILYKCRDMYQNLTKNHGPIDCDLWDAMEIGNSKDHDKSQFFEKHFEIDPDSYISRHDLQNFIERSLESDFSYVDFKQYLKINDLIEDKKVTSNSGKRINAYSGIKLKRK